MDEYGNIQNGASWSKADWNGDGIFDSGDFVIAFQDSGYEMRRRRDVVAAQSLGAWTLLVIGLPLWFIGRRTFAI